MEEKTFTFTGWTAVLVIIAVVGLFGYRIMTFQSLETNEKLVQEVTMLLQHEYFPGDVVGFRLQTRIVGTYLADNNSIFCVGESCYTIPETAYMVQLDISGGVIIPVF